MKRIAIALVLTGIVAPLAVSALTLADLEAQFSALSQAFSAQAGAAATSSAAAPDLSHRVCTILNRNLRRGASGDDVAALQQFLAAQGYFSASATGYFGPLTASAVAHWQASEGISAVGIVGPVSRARIGEWCGGGAVNRKGTFSASPTYGSAPLTVNFSYTTPLGTDPAAQYVVEFGDGQHDIMAKGSCIGMTAIVGGQGGIRCTSSVSHTYAQAGTYTATLSPYIACLYSNPRCMIATMLLGTATIIVTGNSTGGGAVCTTEYAPVCGQPPAPYCPPGAACPMLMLAPQTYGNRCEINAAGATYLHNGACTSPY